MTTITGAMHPVPEGLVADGWDWLRQSVNIGQEPQPAARPEVALVWCN